jgi:carboxymethylenebutenolidase
MALRDYLTSEIVQDCADGLLSRREAVRRLGLMGIGSGAAGALLVACSTEDPAGPPGTGAPTTGSPGATGGTGSVPSGAGSRKGEAIQFPGASGELQAAWAAPDGEPRGGVLVIHENRGLTDHFVELVGRFATAGYAALVVDLLSPEGGTSSITDQAQVPAALSAAPAERLRADLGAGLDELGRRAPGKKLGAVGFCFGGGMVWSLLQAGEPRLAAASPFYGPVPDPADFSRSQAAVLAVFAERDARVNTGRDRAAAALAAAGRPHEVRTFAGDHAFFNDTGPRYDAASAAQAWDALLGWFGRYLA